MVADIFRHGDVAWTATGPHVVVFHPGFGSVHVLDATAAVLWQCLDGASTLDEITADLADAFATDPLRVEADCRPVLGSWLAAGLVATGPREEAVPIGAGVLAAPSLRHLLPPPDT